MEPQALIQEARELGMSPDLIAQYAKKLGYVDEDLPEVPAEQAERLRVEEKALESLALLKEAEELGMSPELIERQRAKMPEIAKYEEYLNQDQAIANAERDQAAYNLEAAEDTIGENLLESTAQASQEIGELFRIIPDGIIGGINWGFGTEIPGINEMLESAGVPLRVGGNENFVEEPFARGAAKAAGMAASVAGGVVPVAERNLATGGGMVAEMLGVGTADDVAKAGGNAMIRDMATRQAQDLSKLSPEARIHSLNEINLDNPEQVLTIAQREADEFIYNENIREMDDLLKQEEWQAGFNDKWRKATDGMLGAQRVLKLKKSTAEEKKAAAKAEKKFEDELIKLEQEGRKVGDEQVKPSRELPIGAHQAAANGLADRFGLSYTDASRAITRAGGIEKRTSFKALDDAVTKNVDDLYDGTADVISWSEKLLRPVTALMRDKVGRGSARQFERAFESSARDGEKLLRKYISRPEALKGLREWMGQRENKADFLNLGHKDFNKSNALLNSIVARAREQLTPEQFNMLKDVIADTRKQNARGRRIYKDEVLQDKLYWTAKHKSKKDESTLARIKGAFNPREADPTSVDTTNQRKRGDARQMTDAQLDQWENPLIAQIDRFNDESMMINLAEEFNMRPSLKLKDDSNKFFDELERQVSRGAGTEKGALARGLAEDTYKGSRKRPPRPVELFMKQSYAGTLGQLDSAMMNMHDIFVSAWRNGTVPTAKAVMETLKRDKDFDIRDLGIGNDATSLEEFRGGIASQLEEMGKLEKGINWYSDKAFKYSGFQAADRFGKGVTLRAAKYAFEDAASNGTLMADFGHLATPKEWAQLKPGLAKGQKLSEFTPKQQELLEKVMFARLGEQQLISMAGRPLLYLQNPVFRPFWAMSGFAIKQADMLKMAVLDEAKKGNYAEAGKAAAEYMLFVAVGYSVVDTLRNLPSYLMTGDERKAPSIERMLGRIIEQPMAAATLNKVGSPADLKRAFSNPMDFAYGTIEPSGGFIGNAASDIGDLIQGEMPKGKILKSIPFGDPIYDMANK